MHFYVNFDVVHGRIPDSDCVLETRHGARGVPCAGLDS